MQGVAAFLSGYKRLFALCTKIIYIRDEIHQTFIELSKVSTHVQYRFSLETKAAKQNFIAEFRRVSVRRHFVVCVSTNRTFSLVLS